MRAPLKRRAAASAQATTPEKQKTVPQTLSPTSAGLLPAVTPQWLVTAGPGGLDAAPRAEGYLNCRSTSGGIAHETVRLLPIISIVTVAVGAKAA
jgi:hypothetical protein